MIRGFYTAASGMLAQEKRLNAIANNIANVNTVGYKKDDLVFSTFGEHIAVRMNKYNMGSLHRIGEGNWMQVTQERYTDFAQGGFETTNRALDMAIRGDGFFVISTPDGNRLTRDGQFALCPEGYLELPNFGRVQGQDGDINTEGRSDFFVARNGEIFLPNEEGEMEMLDRLLIALPYDHAALEREPSKLWLATEYAIADEAMANTTIFQHHVERSNVNMAQEMTRMMAAQRSLQSASALVRMHDEMSEQGSRRISSMR